MTTNTEKTSISDPIRVDFVSNQEFSFLTRLGMTFAPGKKQPGAISGNWNRDLRTDLLRLREFYGVDILISLVEEVELDELCITELAAECERCGIEIWRFPIVDGSIPESAKDYLQLVSKAAAALLSGKTILHIVRAGSDGRARPQRLSRSSQVVLRCHRPTQCRPFVTLEKVRSKPRYRKSFSVI